MKKGAARRWMRCLVRLSLLPLMMVFEWLLMLACWLLAGIYPPAAFAIVDWAETNLPNLEWYLPNDQAMASADTQTPPKEPTL